jgi:serine/threonine-protein kinase
LALSPGSLIGPYEVRALLGAGGMGEVYRARDPRLGRDVAIKVLPAQFAENPDRVRRLEQEARAIAALNHPHICQIHDVGPGYLVLEYIEGMPLTGPLSSGEALRLALQIAEALHVAHQKGILHRDLKPANIFVTRDGRAKVLDFGLAKVMTSDRDVTRTSDGTVAGTAAYMSPEQLEGRELDARSDVFSFGLVLYEILSGTRAFGGDTVAQVLRAVLRDDPPPLRTLPALERIVQRCLAKDASRRYQTMGEVAAALAQTSGVTPVDQQPSIAVLPFANMSRDPDDEYFSDGLAEEIINVLAHVSGLKVIARTSAFAFKGKHEDIRGIARALDVTNILEGSVRRAGSRVRITAQLISAKDGTHLWSERYDRELTDVFAIQDDIASAIAVALEVTLAGTPAYKPDPRAYDALQRGRYQRQRLVGAPMVSARECFKQAIALDAKYAAPHAELALTQLLLSINGEGAFKDIADVAGAEARRALDLDPSETNPHAVLGAIAAARDYDWTLAAEHFDEAVSGSSMSADARWAHACLYLLPLGRLHESVDQMQRAVDQDPLNVGWRGVLGSLLNATEQYDRALEELRKALELDENHVGANFVIGETYWRLGRFAEATAAAETAHRLVPSHSMCWGLLAAVLAHEGDRNRAAALIAEHGDWPTPVWGRVWYHLLCAELDEAAHWYRVSIEQREPFALMFANYPVTKALRASHHWSTLASSMNLPVTA